MRKSSVVSSSGWRSLPPIVSAMSSSRITYVSGPDATPESELSALAAAYRFVLDSAKKEGSRPGAPDAEKGSKHDSRLPKCTG